MPDSRQAGFCEKSQDIQIRLKMCPLAWRPVTVRSGSMFRIRTGLVGVAAGLLAGLMWVAAPVAHAQGRDMIRCGSNDGRFQRCQVPWRDAEMIRQESNSP